MYVLLSMVVVQVMHYIFECLSLPMASMHGDALSMDRMVFGSMMFTKFATSPQEPSESVKHVRMYTTNCELLLIVGQTNSTHI